VSDAAFEVLKKAAADRKAIFTKNPDFLERFSAFAADDQAFLNGIKTPAFDAFSRLPDATQSKFLRLTQRVYTPPATPSAPAPATVSFRTNFTDLPADRQAALMTGPEIDAMENVNAMDQKFTTDSGAAKEGHGFAEHGAIRSDQEMFDRAKRLGRSVSRYNTATEQELQATRARAILEDPAMPDKAHSAINSAGQKAIAKGKITAERILGDPVNNRQFLKAKVDFLEIPAGHVVGTEFLPDGVTTNPVENVTIIFVLDASGNYQVLTNFPAKP
jgi:hypothetical protein